MLNIIEINKILSLLNLCITFENGKYHMINYENNTSTILEKHDSFYEYTLIRGEELFFLKINQNEVRITTGSKQILINKEGFYYQEKEKKDENLSSIRVYGNQMSFYINQGIFSSGIELKNSNSNLIHMKTKQKMVTKDDRRKDTEIEKKENGVIKNTLYRIYSLEGKLVNSANENEELTCTLDEAIINELSKFDTPENSIAKIESFIPGITEYLSSINQACELVLENKQNIKKS